MKEEKFSEINLLDIGNTIQISGAIWTGNGKNYLCFLPGENNSENETVSLDISLEEWKSFIRQSDLLETEILARDTEDKLVKIICRKSTRQIDQVIQWKVYFRDKFRCRYCNRIGVPLSVDHIILWEEGGPSTEENLITACKKCNKTRGSMHYEEWLKSPYYRRVSNDLSGGIFNDNEEILKRLDSIPRRIHVISR